jgi:hypothetical protein
MNVIMCLYVRLEIDSRLRDGVALAVRAKVRDAAATAYCFAVLCKPMVMGFHILHGITLYFSGLYRYYIYIDWSSCVGYPEIFVLAKDSFLE